MTARASGGKWTIAVFDNQNCTGEPKSVTSGTCGKCEKATVSGPPDPSVDITAAVLGNALVRVNCPNPNAVGAGKTMKLTIAVGTYVAVALRWG